MGKYDLAINIVKGSLNSTRNGYSNAVIAPGLRKNFHGVLNEDTVSLSCKTAGQINKALKNIYNIDSSLKNQSLAEKILSAVEDFCKVNKKNNLFSGLKLREDVVGNTTEAAISKYSEATKDYKIIFNETFEWNNLDKITKEMYHAGKIPSDNPKCLLYSKLGEFLNFRYNPHAYKVTTEKDFCNGYELTALRLTDSVKISDFNANYIAGRMCGKSYPKALYTEFEDNLGNIDLRFPKPIPTKMVEGSVHKFKRIEDVQKYLLENYGIEAEFITQQQANIFAGAVDDLSKMAGSKEYFRGLKVTIDPKINSIENQMALYWNCEKNKAHITINPAYNWKNEIKISKKDYQAGFRATENPKGIYIHELAHWLDFKGNPTRYGIIEKSFAKGSKVFNEYEKSVTAKVSEYAATSPAEFCAEYIAGRFNGIKYPKCCDDEFLARWHGPSFTFFE